MAVVVVIRRSWAWLERFAADPRKLLVLDSLILVVLAGLITFIVFFVLRTNDALCNFRSDLQERADSAERFLHDNPGDLFLGKVVIPRSQLRDNLRNQRATLRSLNDLPC